jgi:hypothetical protein
VARIIEGCNAISVLILFISFVFSFRKVKTHGFFILEVAWFYFKCFTAILSVLMYHFPGEVFVYGVYFFYLFMGCFSFVGNLD